MPEYARNSFDEPYECKLEWGCFVQCGGSGVVLGSKPYRTAFFEAFPRDPDTFIRGEGETIEEAEAVCMKKWEKYRACSGHEFEKRGYKNGAGFCKHCNLFKSKCFDPWEACVDCGELTFYGYDKDDNLLCEPCYDKMSEDRMTKWQLEHKRRGERQKEREAKWDAMSDEEREEEKKKREEAFKAMAANLAVAHVATEGVLDDIVEKGEPLELDGGKGFEKIVEKTEEAIKRASGGS